MDCQKFATLLDDRRGESLTPSECDAATTHMFDCEDCRSAWNAVQRLQVLRELPAPAPRVAFLSETATVAAKLHARESQRRSSLRKVAGIGAALAASVVIGAAAVMQIDADIGADSLSSVVIALNETRDVRVGIAAQEALPGAQIHVSLLGGIEIAGSGGRRELSWNADLDSGLNRLTLPITLTHAGGGEVLVEVEHLGKRREFHVSVVGDGAAAVPI